MTIHVRQFPCIYQNASKTKKSKDKGQEPEINPLLTLVRDFDHTQLLDLHHRIADSHCEFDLYKLRNWLKQKFEDQEDHIRLWESTLPTYMFPRTHYFPEIVIWCQTSYIPEKRAIISRNAETLFTITADSISQMLQAPVPESAQALSIESLKELYNNLSFPREPESLRYYYLRMPNCPSQTLLMPQACFQML